MQRFIGFMMVTVGVSMAAAYGAQNTPDVTDRLTTLGQAEVPLQMAAKARAEYCEARVTAKLPKGECEDPKKAKAEKKEPESEEAKAKAKAEGEAKAKMTPEQKRAALLAEKRAELAALKAKAEPTLEGMPAEARQKWMEAVEKTIEPSVTAALLPPPPEGTDRLKRWAGLAGWQTLLGMILIIAGAFIARKAAHAEATAVAPSDGKTRGPVDFGDLLRELETGVRTLHADMVADVETPASSGTARGAAFEAYKKRIEAFQYDYVEPMVDSRIKVQTRFGMAGFAALFSPMSGGERNLNRAWSALVDDHWPEAINATLQSSRSLKDAVQELETRVAQLK